METEKSNVNQLRKDLTRAFDEVTNNPQSVILTEDFEKQIDQEANEKLK